MLHLDKLKELKKRYEEGENITSYLKELQGLGHNTNEIIQIAYDLQAGSYIENVNKNPKFNIKYTRAIAEIINCLEYQSIMEVGVGESTTMANVLNQLTNVNIRSYGFDLSWSRVKKGVEYCSSKGQLNTMLFTGDLFNIPMQENAIDVVYTSHSIEPNGGREKEALQELYRVTNKYLILLEPGYEFTSAEGKKRMEKLGYVKGLKNVALDLGYQVIDHRLFDHSVNPLNPTALLIIEKKGKTDLTNPLACPITHTPLVKVEELNCFYATEAFLAYPIIGGIPCLLPTNAIIASKLLK